MIKHALATIERGAVGNHAIAITEALKEQNISVPMYAETIRPEYVSTVQNIDVLASEIKSDDVVLYQFANPSIMADLLYEKECRLIVNYHNVTPAHFFARWFPAAASAIARARSQLARLATVSSAAIAVSEYNAAELVSLGYRNVEVIPPLISETFFGEDAPVIKRNNSWLFVGRIAPHKNIHVLIHALEIYRRDYDDQATLTIVGSTDTPLYARAIDELITERSLNDAVHMIPNASLDLLIEQYTHSSVFVSASEHEGFCLPLIEAMASSLPVVALDAAAVHETGSSAATYISEPNPTLLAEAVHDLLDDPNRYDQFCERGKTRSSLFHPQEVKQQYVDYFRGWI